LQKYGVNAIIAPSESRNSEKAQALSEKWQAYGMRLHEKVLLHELSQIMKPRLWQKANAVVKPCDQAIVS
jgi:hypothetical protein